MDAESLRTVIVAVLVVRAAILAAGVYAGARVLGWIVGWCRYVLRPRMGCHFCGHRADSHEYSGGFCPRTDCGQYNRFNEDGSYLRDFPALYDDVYNSKKLRSPTPFVSHSSNVLCAVCEQLQLNMVRRLQRMEPSLDPRSQVQRMEAAYDCDELCRLRADAAIQGNIQRAQAFQIQHQCL